MALSGMLRQPLAMWLLLCLSLILRTTKGGRQGELGTLHHEESKFADLSQLTHGWDCIMCETNSMLAGNFGHNQHAMFNMSDTWWIGTVAKSYAAVALNNFFGSSQYNGTGESGKVTVAKALKTVNPRIKILFYYAPTFISDSPFVLKQFMAHPEWWLRDDYGNVIWQKNTKSLVHPCMDPTVPEFRTWFANLPLSYFSSKEEAAKYIDGVFVDGSGYMDVDFNKNISLERYSKLFAGKMQMMQLAQQTFTELNGGDVWGNNALENHPRPDVPGNMTWRTTLQHFNTAFEEMFGSYSTQNKDGSWNRTLMERSIDDIIAASTAGHGVIIHSSPGPCTPPFRKVGEGDNYFMVPSWAGPEKLPLDADSIHEAASRRLVESLAPFLIVANERVFLSYAWFYDIQDGYIPCKSGVECGMPSSWYPEFSRPLGPPKGVAQRNGTVWTREFEHASVYIDLRDRSASRITWS